MPDHLAGLLGEAAHESVAVWPCPHAIIVVFHNDGLLAGVPAREQDHDLAGLHPNNHNQQAGGTATSEGCHVVHLATAADRPPVHAP
jgi:hypothetical protein